MLMPFVLLGCGSDITREEQRGYCESVGMVLGDYTSGLPKHEEGNTVCISYESHCIIQCNDLYKGASDADVYFLNRCFDECTLNLENK